MVNVRQQETHITQHTHEKPGGLYWGAGVVKALKLPNLSVTAM